MTDTVLYAETHRPQFHFTPARHWTNDPNGLVFYAGEYHLFFQHNPTSVRWGNMTWGHAVSTDLVHWTQLPNAIEPDELGTIYSGSAVVDWHDTGGFRQGDGEALVAFYTAAGVHADPPRPFTQCLAYSTDRGRTWTKYPGNPVVGHLRGHNRDPKVIWHAPSRRWLMALYLDGNAYALLHSADLRRWELLQELTLPGVSECPDFFPLPVDDDPRRELWVFWGASGGYRLGRFDGQSFQPLTGVLQAELGPNGYAAQTFSDIPAEDGRRIQISWMRGGRYPAMPFNQQMSFPVALALRTTAEGPRLCRWPVREIERLYAAEQHWQDVRLAPGAPLVPASRGELFDIELELEPGGAARVGLEVRGIRLEYGRESGTLSFQQAQAAIPLRDGRLRLRCLVDRTSLEVFAGQGEQSLSCCFLPEAADHPLEAYADGGTACLRQLRVRELRSIWMAAGT